MAESKKSPHAEREEKVLAHWKDKDIFQKTLDKESPKGEFVFYEGPPTANGRPGIHHLEARAFKDAIPRYKTMRGFHVRRKGGWDTHGLPVELQVEKELGFKSKKDIDAYGIAAFNEKCKESVWKYVHEWEDFTERMGYWVDLKDPYITYKPDYIESVWNILKTADEKGLLYKDYRVTPWCPHDGTVLSSHELAQGYETVKDLSLYVKFELVDEPRTYFVAWTTTPWTLPGNVALAVGPEIIYSKIKLNDEILIASSDAIIKNKVFQTNPSYQVIQKGIKGSDLIGKKYRKQFSFTDHLFRDQVSLHMRDSIIGDPSVMFSVFGADFVNTDEGTGIVHIAPAFGDDDFKLRNANNLPLINPIDETGVFREDVGDGFAGKSVIDEQTNIEILKYLEKKGLYFDKLRYEHSYPFCWRCKTRLIYFARDSWYIRMSELRNKLVKENEGIHWEPDYIREGRFGEWLKDVKDWAISRERYWGTPLPVWVCEKCKKRKVVGSIAEIAEKPRNEYFVMRHGESENNVAGMLSSDPGAPNHLTENGKAQVSSSADKFSHMKLDLVFTSPLVRTKETSEIIRVKFGLKSEQVIIDDRLREMGLTDEWERNRKAEDFFKVFPLSTRFESAPPGIENYVSIKDRMGSFLFDLEKRYEGKTILIVTHGSPAMMLMAAAAGLDKQQAFELESKRYLDKGELRKLDFKKLPHNSEYELDLHRPYIDEVKLPCDCGGEMSRVKEVMDVWLDSGAMPFAQDHYPFEKHGGLLGIGAHQKLAYPADFISEAIDQTRGWFYTLHAVGMIMGKGKAFKNVVCLGHILDEKGKKMSKSIGNVVDPWSMMDQYGADALRFWMYSVNQPGESKNFDVKTVDEVNKKVFNLASNVLSFYKLYETKGIEAKADSPHILDRWIVSRLNELVLTVTNHLDAYVFLEPTRAIRDFIADLSQWYVRRSRDRFREDGPDKQEALETTKHIIITLAKVMAPFTPFFADYIYVEAGGHAESVHLRSWPEAGKVDSALLKSMESVRSLSSKGLEARTAAKMNVRQPLAALKVREPASIFNLDEGSVEIIKDELNVKSVVFGASIEKEVELDLNITPELREEGEFRELLRKIQDLRKEKGLSVGDMAVLVAPESARELISKNEAKVKKATNLSSIEYGPALGLK